MPRARKKTALTTENQTTAANSGFGPLGIDGKLLESAARAGFVEPKPIQVAAIPAQIAGKDILGVAQTGSCLLYTSPSPRDLSTSRMPSSA